MRKAILLSLLILIVASASFAQDIIKRTRRITPYVTEKYTVTIGADREIKQGLYQALYNKKFALASGKYVDDKRVGLWHFFNRQGELIENYNYDTRTLQYEAVEDTTSNMRYIIDYELKDTDRVTKPIKVGGRYFAYLPYLNLFKLPPDLEDINPAMYDVMLELLISPGGRLADYKIHLRSRWAERTLNVNIKQIKDEDKQFIPATLNKNPVAARITIQCYITDTGELDML